MTESDNDKAELVRLRSVAHLEKRLAEHREESKKIYAIKLVEQVVWGMVGFILLAVVGAVIATVLR